MRYAIVTTLLSLPLLTACGSVPSAPQTPDPAMCINSLPALEPKLEDAQGLLSIETMRSFLSGSLVLRAASSLSATPATGSTTRRTAD